MRGQLISAIELQMAVFLLGPALDLVMPVTVVAGALLLAFEVAMIVQFWLSARAFSRQLAPSAEPPSTRRRPPPAPRPAGQSALSTSGSAVCSLIADPGARVSLAVTSAPDVVVLMRSSTGPTRPAKDTV